MLEIWVDGSCKGNPGTGAWGAIIIKDGEFYDCVASEIYEQTTNNRMELSAIIWAAATFGSSFGDVPIVWSDSAYCVNSCNNWLKGWQERGWTKANGELIENLDLFQTYARLNKQIDLRKTSGHSGELWNEVADSLATRKLTVREVIKKYGR